MRDSSRKAMPPTAPYRAISSSKRIQNDLAPLSGTSANTDSLRKGRLAATRAMAITNQLATETSIKSGAERFRHGVDAGAEQRAWQQAQHDNGHAVDRQRHAHIGWRKDWR